MSILEVLFGAIVGLSLGLTGGGGSIFAVPLLVYGIGLGPKLAVPVSLAAVGATALVGFLQRLHAKEVEVTTGLVFAVAGLLGTPIGKAIGDRLPDRVLMVLFACLMAYIARRMWLKSQEEATAAASAFLRRAETAPTTPLGCSRDAGGHINLTTRCGMVLVSLGFGVGILSGVFGVGGGFVIVPALVLFTNMRIHQAVSTSLMVISIISAGGVLTFVSGGRDVSFSIVAMFVIGGILGMQLGTWFARMLPGKQLQRFFAGAIVFVAAFVLIKETLGF